MSTQSTQSTQDTQERQDSRRNFIKKGVSALAGVTIITQVNKAANEEKPAVENPKKEYKRIFRTLGKTGIKLPVISMGVMNADNPKLVEAALDSGIIHLDTAWYYQGGRNEEMIGEVIKGRPRDSFVIATKVWEPRDNQTGLYPKEATSASFVEKFETSLKRLGLDYVDILYHHNITRVESLMYEPYLNALTKFKKEGKARFIGSTTHQNEPEIIRASADSNIYEVVLTSYNFRQLHHEEVRKAAAYAAGKGLGIVGMKAIRGRSKSTTGKKPEDIATAAIKWALQDENFHTNIAGMTTFDQLYTDLSIMADLTLSPAEKVILEEELKVASLYCQQCTQCLAQCGQRVAIPDLMRSYMYVYGYKNLTAAKETLDCLDLHNLPCRSCSQCRVKCTMGFDIKSKILDVARIADVPAEFLA